MKNEKVTKYKIAFKFVTVLNLILVLILLEYISGQDILPRNQTTIVVKVVPQGDSPLMISIMNVENSDPTFQNIVYSVKNISNQPIRAFTIAGDSIISNSFASQLLLPGGVYIGNMSVERKSIKPGFEVNLLIDYVEFARGSTWGRDVYGKSKQIRLERQGRVEAIRLLKNFIRNGNPMAINNILSQDVARMAIPKPQQNLNNEDEKGFGRGFKSIISILQKIENKTLDSINRKLDELESVNQ